MSISDSNSTDNAVPGGGLAKPVMLALGALLVGKMLTGHKDDGEAATSDQPAGEPGTPTGGVLGGALGGLSKLLEGNSQAPAAPGTLTGGLAGVLNQLTQAGYGDKVASWLGQGENHPIEPGQLGNALGQSTVNALAQHAGLEPQTLLANLSQALPGLVDKLTANGQVPDSNQIASVLKSVIPTS
ncbi:YidB family protein [Brucella intermedia]|uniref:YidB family protein n=1 Tax=Brucella intermedia TaxID=94625 RepID=UPI0023615599|nr:YidB family protein [Brucella intermedia]